MKTFLLGILILFLFVTMMGVVINDKTLFHVNEVSIQIEVKESDRLAWLDVNKKIQAGLEVYKGMPLWRVSLTSVKRQLVAFPFLKKVQVQKSWPSKLEISYSLPPLRAIYSPVSGKYQVLAEGGHWVGPVTWARLPGLPWLRGDWVMKKSLLTPEVLSLLDRIPTQGPLAVDQISEIQFSDLDGFLLTLVKTGQQIRFGLDNFEIKSLRGTQVLDYLQNRGLESRVIDLNFSKKVLVRLRNHP